jgi:myotubularin-related protein 5/13
MIYLLCPLELNPRRTVGRRIDDFENASNSISNSVAESDSVDAESGFEDQEIPDHGQVRLFSNCFFLVHVKTVSLQNVIKIVMRFADKVCNESQVTPEHIKAVNSVSSFVHSCAFDSFITFIITLFDALDDTILCCDAYGDFGSSCSGS